MPKENLIIVHSFPGNSILLNGFIEYLSDYFEVYFIDLPGFTKAVPPLAEITFEGYRRFIARKIKALEIESYWLGGISFGFFLISQLQPDARCRGFVAMAPYLGLDSLQMKGRERGFFRLFFKGINHFKLWPLLWSHPLSRKYLPKLRNYSPECVDNMARQVDSRTFFQTASIILDNHETCRFKRLPYILIASEQDRTINYDYVFRTFTANASPLLVVNTTMGHAPPRLTKSHFMSQLPDAVMKIILEFMRMARKRSGRWEPGAKNGSVQIKEIRGVKPGYE